MSKKEVFQIRIDARLKKAALAEADRRGVSLAELVRDFLKEIAKCKK